MAGAAGGGGGRAAPRVGQIGVPAPPPDRGRWYAGAIGASSPHGPEVPQLLIEIRFIKFNFKLASIDIYIYQTKSIPLEGLARPRALYHDRHPMVRSKGPPVRGPLPCRRAQS